MKEDEQQVWPFKQEFTISSQEAEIKQRSSSEIGPTDLVESSFYGLLGCNNCESNSSYLAFYNRKRY